MTDPTISETGMNTVLELLCGHYIALAILVQNDAVINFLIKSIMIRKHAAILGWVTELRLGCLPNICLNH